MEKLRRLKLNARMVFYILSASIVLFTLTIVYNAYKTRQIAKENAKTLIQSKTKEYSYNISKIFESAIEQADAINASIIGVKQNGNCDRQAVNYTIKNILKKNAEFIGVWTCWEPNKFDCKDSLYSNKDGYDRTGRLIEYVNRNSGGENNIDNIKNNIISGANDYYSISKNNDEEVLTEPYGLYRGENKIYVVSVLVPIHDNGIVVGVTGIDIDLKKLEEINSEIKLFNNGFGKIISNKGIVVAHPQKENIGLPTVEIKDGNHEVRESIKNGKDYTNILYSYTNKTYSYKSFTPIKAGNIKSPWSYCIQVPLNEILAESDSGIKSSLLVGIIGLILLGIIIYLLSKRIANPIIRTTNALKLVSEGILNEENKVDISTNDELNEMGNAVNRLVDGLREKAEFARKIGEGELEAEYKAASEKDVLGNSLIEMRKSLLEAAAAEKIRKSEDTKRNWATNGLAQIGEILRKTEADDNTLYFNITSYIVKYLDCNQGGLFIINNENEKDEHLELVAMYAFNKKKYISKRVEIGEGLLGTCVLEKDTIYMTEVPDNYIEITSGLGKANPRSILIVPLKLNDSVHGVLELASFKEIEKYQIEFVEKLAESIASTISNVKINIRTKLLLEQSQRQTEQLKSQEEEMRQNLEELTATQEESHRKALDLERLLKEAADNESQMRTQEEELRQNMEELQATQEEANRKSIEMERLLRESEEKERLLREKEDELQMNMEELVATQEEASRKERIRMEELEKQKSEMTGLLKAIDKTLAVLEYDFNGNILHVNEILCNLSGYSSDELVGKHYSLFFDNKDINNSELYKKFWENMRSGKCFDGIIKCVAKDGNPFLIKGICNPIFDLNGNPVKVMEMAFEISGDSIN